MFDIGLSNRSSCVAPPFRRAEDPVEGWAGSLQPPKPLMCRQRLSPMVGHRSDDLCEIRRQLEPLFADLVPNVGKVDRSEVADGLSARRERDAA